MSLSEIYMLIKRAHWDFYWPKYACINLAAVWTVDLLCAWHMFRLINFFVSQIKPATRGIFKFSQTYVFVRCSNKLHHFPPLKYQLVAALSQIAYKC